MMKKSILTTVLTFTLALTMIGGNAVFAANMLESEVPNISVEVKQVKVPDEHTDAKANGVSSTDPQPDTKVSESEAIKIAKASIVESYDVNTDGLRVFTVIGQTEKTTENVWFVTFIPDEFTDEAPQKRRGVDTAVYTTYVLLINADTGEIVEMEQNIIDRANPPKYNSELDGPGLG